DELESCNEENEKLEGHINDFEELQKFACKTIPELDFSAERLLTISRSSIQSLERSVGKNPPDLSQKDQMMHDLKEVSAEMDRQQEEEHVLKMRTMKEEQAKFKEMIADREKEIELIGKGFEREAEKTEDLKICFEKVLDLRAKLTEKFKQTGQPEPTEEKAKLELLKVSNAELEVQVQDAEKYLIEVRRRVTGYTMAVQEARSAASVVLRTMEWESSSEGGSEGDDSYDIVRYAAIARHRRQSGEAAHRARQGPKRRSIAFGDQDNVEEVVYKEDVAERRKGKLKTKKNIALKSDDAEPSRSGTHKLQKALTRGMTRSNLKEKMEKSTREAGPESDVSLDSPPMERKGRRLMTAAASLLSMASGSKSTPRASSIGAGGKLAAAARALSGSSSGAGKLATAAGALMPQSSASAAVRKFQSFAKSASREPEDPADSPSIDEIQGHESLADIAAAARRIAAAAKVGKAARLFASKMEKYSKSLVEATGAEQAVADEMLQQRAVVELKASHKRRASQEVEVDDLQGAISPAVSLQGAVSGRPRKGRSVGFVPPSSSPSQPPVPDEKVTKRMSVAILLESLGQGSEPTSTDSWSVMARKSQSIHRYSLSLSSDWFC
ncbi:unnamed protein product, partial [Polarella glacialis]